MKTVPNAWRDNLKSKVQELLKLVLNYMTTHDQNAVDEIKRKIVGLKDMFGTDQVPPVVVNLQGAFDNFSTNKHTAYFNALMSAYNGLPTVSQFSDEDESLSFDQIFESYKSDADLQSMVDEVVRLIRQILDENDDQLTAQIARELETILAELKKRESKSLYELQAWLDLGTRALILTAEVHYGLHGINLVYEAIKTGVKAQRQLINNHAAAQKKLMDSHKLTHTAKAVAHLPETITDEDLSKRLPQLEGGSTPPSGQQPTAS